jgi:hypothetical protein
VPKGKANLRLCSSLAPSLCHRPLHRMDASARTGAVVVFRCVPTGAAAGPQTDGCLILLPHGGLNSDAVLSRQAQTDIHASVSSQVLLSVYVVPVGLERCSALYTQVVEIGEYSCRSLGDSRLGSEDAEPCLRRWVVAS